MPRHSPKEELRLIDQNVNMKGLEPLRCDICGYKIQYQKNAPPPQCPQCYAAKGVLVPLKKYFFLS